MDDDADAPLQIRSFRVCFQLERRIHKIDRWRIPVPYGVPVRGIVYASIILIAVVALGRLPVTGDLLATLHPSLRYLALPGGAAYLLLRWKVDGRPAHITALAWARMQAEPRRIAGWRPAPAPGAVHFDAITIAPDERSPRLRPGVVEGAGPVILRYPVTLVARGRTLRVTAAGDAALWRGKQVNLHDGERMVVLG